MSVPGVPEEARTDEIEHARVLYAVAHQVADDCAAEATR